MTILISFLFKKYNYIIIMSNNNYNITNCILSKGFLPSFKPVIYNLSVNTSVAGAYSFVAIYGYNFLPNGTTYVNFGNYKKIPITFFSSNNISFVVPANALAGSYNVIVVNNYTSNYGSHINNFYNENLNFSNSISYTLT
jgi:hypothetical protein